MVSFRQYRVENEKRAFRRYIYTQTRARVQSNKVNSLRQDCKGVILLKNAVSSKRGYATTKIR